MTAPRKPSCALIVSVLVALPTPAAVAAEVAADQRQVAIGYERLETLALRIADAVEPTDAARSEQIRRAIGEARAVGIRGRFDKVVALLERERYTSARRDQGELAAQLEELLRTVMADPNAAQLERELQRLERLRREIRGALREQKALRSRTDRGESQELVERQKELAERIERLREPAEATDRLNGREVADLPPEDNGEALPPKGQDKPPSDQGKPSIAKSLEAGRKAMRAAEQKLASGDDASDDQLEAQRELEAAQREAEERLRQVREEEQQRRLASLAERFRRMHEAQSRVLADTEKRAEAMQTDRRSTASRAGRLATAKIAASQGEIGATAEQALRVVRADGSSLVFDDALVQVIDDIRTAEDRLRNNQVDATTLALERSVLETLADMIAAVDDSLEQLDKQKNSSAPPQGNQQAGEQGLVSKIGELRMIRSMQARLLRQTKAWRAAEVAGDAPPAEVTERLSQLADRQRRLAIAARAVGGQKP